MSDLLTPRCTQWPPIYENMTGVIYCMHLHGDLIFSDFFGFIFTSDV